MFRHLLNPELQRSADIYRVLGQQHQYLLGIRRPHFMKNEFYPWNISWAYLSGGRIFRRRSAFRVTYFIASNKRSPNDNRRRASAAMFPNFNIAEDQDIVIAGRAFAKPVVMGNFSSIGQQIADGNVTTKFFRHLATAIENEIFDGFTKIHAIRSRERQFCG
jgi:hypothetical protein